MWESEYALGGPHILSQTTIERCIRRINQSVKNFQNLLALIG